MEVLILLLASDSAILDTFALAYDLKDPPLATELAVPNLNAPLILVRVGEARRTDLHNYDFIAHFKFINCQLAANVGLNRLTRERNTRVLLALALFSLS